MRTRRDGAASMPLSPKGTIGPQDLSTDWVRMYSAVPADGLNEGGSVPTPMSTSRTWLVAVALLACIVLAGVAGWSLGRSSSIPGAHHPADAMLGKAPSYHDLVDQLGQHVDSRQFKGKVQLVTFLFPYCTTYCPLIAAHLVGFEHVLRQSGLQDKVQLVAFDVDPSGTGPKQMRAFMKEYGWNPHDLHWQYLTGKPATIRRVVTKGFHIAYYKESDSEEQASGSTQNAQTPQPTVVNPLAQKARVNYDVTHNDGLVVIGPGGNIRRVYDQADLVSPQQLLTQVQNLLPGSTAGRTRMQ